MVSGEYCREVLPDTVCWTRLKNTCSQCLQEGEGAPEQGPESPGCFPEFLEPRLEVRGASLGAPQSLDWGFLEPRLEAQYPLRAFRGFVPISGTPSLFLKTLTAVIVL